MSTEEDRSEIVPVTESTSNKGMEKAKLRAMFDTAKDSDVTIEFGEHSVKAHKSVLMSQSTWFQRAFGGRFSEAHASTLELKGDDPIALMALFKHCYGFKFFELLHRSKKRKEIDSPIAAMEPDHGLSQYAAIFVVADKYDVEALRTRVTEMLHRCLNRNAFKLFSTNQMRLIVSLVQKADSSATRPFLDILYNVIEPKMQAFSTIDSSKLQALLEQCPELAARIAIFITASRDTHRLQLREQWFDDEPDLGMNEYVEDIDILWAAKSSDWESFQGVLNERNHTSAIRALSDDGETALHWAASYGSPLKIVKCLVTWAHMEGYEIIGTRSDYYGRTALDWAKELNSERAWHPNTFKPIVDYLESQVAIGAPGEKCCGSEACGGARSKGVIWYHDKDRRSGSCFPCREYATRCLGSGCCEACEVSKFLEQGLFAPSCHHDECDWDYWNI